MLGILLCQPTVTAVQPHAAVDGQVVLLWSAEEFYAGRTRPTVSRRIAHRRTSVDVDASLLLIVHATEEVFLVRNE